MTLQPIALPSPAETAGIDLFTAIKSRRSVRAYSEKPLDLGTLSTLLFYTCGRAGTGPRRLLAPSAGNIHAISVFVVASRVEGLPQGIYRYDADTHALTLHLEGDHRTPIRTACLNQAMPVFAAVCIVLASDTAKIAERYRDRAPRYAAMDCGHYGQNIYLTCEGLGMATVAVGAFEDLALGKAMALPEGLAPMYLFPVGYKE